LVVLVPPRCQRRGHQFLDLAEISEH
jgi:hypothetical protein